MFGALEGSHSLPGAEPGNDTLTMSLPPQFMFKLMTSVAVAFFHIS